MERGRDGGCAAAALQATHRRLCEEKMITRVEGGNAPWMAMVMRKGVVDSAISGDAV